MSSQRERILDRIAEADSIQVGDSGEVLAIGHYSSTPLTSKYLVIACREVHAATGFIVTAYLTRRPSAVKTVLWTR
jgi:hypothetical protein